MLASSNVASVSYSEQEMELGTDKELEPFPERSSSGDSVAASSDAVAQVSILYIAIHIKHKKGRDGNNQARSFQQFQKWP